MKLLDDLVGVDLARASLLALRFIWCVYGKVWTGTVAHVSSERHCS